MGPGDGGGTARARARLLAATVLAGAVALSALAPPADAQDAGRRLTVGVTAGATANDNIRLRPGGGDGTASADARLDFSYVERTPIQSLRLAGSGDYRAVGGDGAGDDLTGLDGPSLSFGYERAVPSAALSANAFYNRRRLELDGTRGRLTGFLENPFNPILGDPSLLDLDPEDFALLDPEDIEIDPVLVSDILGDLIDEDDEGIRERFGVSTRLTLRRDTPLQVVLSASTTAVRYSDGAVQGDTDTVRLGAGLRFLLDPVTTGALDLSYGTFEDEATVAEGSTGAVILDEASDLESVGVSGSLTRRVPLGRYGVSANTTETDDGRRYGFTLNASRRLPLWDLDGRIGLTRETTGDLETVGRLSVSRALPRGDVQLDATRSVLSGEDGDERVVTTLGLDYALALTPIVDLSADAAFVSSTATRGRDDESEGFVGVRLSRALTEDLTASVGLRHRFEDDGRSGGTARDNVLTLDLRRSFTFLP